MKFLKWFWKAFMFASCFPLFFIAFFMEGLKKGADAAFGLDDPMLQCVQNYKHYWKDLWGIVPVKCEIDVVRGYMYHKQTYSDGSQLFFR